MKNIANDIFPNGGRAQINGFYSSSDGLVQGDSSFVSSYEEIVKKNNKLRSEWAEKLKLDGVKASHPDDGWVDRKENYVQFCYPQFIESIEVGDEVALGDFDKYRVVKIVSVEKSGFGLAKYYFSPNPD